MILKLQPALSTIRMNNYIERILIEVNSELRTGFTSAIHAVSVCWASLLSNPVRKPLRENARALSMGHLGPCPPPIFAPPPYFWINSIKILVNAVKVAFCPSNSHFRGQNSLNIAKFRWLLGLRPRPRLFFSGCRRSPENLAQSGTPPLFWGHIKYKSSIPNVRKKMASGDVYASNRIG